MTSTIHDDQYTVLIVSRWMLLRMRNVSDKRCRENQNTHIVLINFFSKIIPFVRYFGKNMVEPQRPQITIWRMRFACWISTATSTHPEYVKLLHNNDSYVNAPHCYVICTSPVFFSITLYESQCWRRHVLLAVIWFRLVEVWPVLSAAMCVTRHQNMDVCSHAIPQRTNLDVCKAQLL